MNRYRTHILPMFLTLILFVAGCTNSERQMRKLAQVDSLMEENPQAAYDSLCRNQKEMTQGGARQVEMRHRRLMAKAENKLYKPMPSASVFQDVVDYYDHKGTSNEKMEAHYLMGCIYRDQKEAPRAIQWYHQAVDCADTVSIDCDYNTLSRIYGQIADIYSKQNLPAEALKANYLFGLYALKTGNKYNYLRSKELSIPLYYSMGDTIATIAQIKQSAQLYKQNGMTKEATHVYPLLIRLYLKKQQYSEAAIYMNIYEKQSGLFDKNGNIIKDREGYYELKGLYYLGINQPDSAIRYFKKLNSKDHAYEANRGILLASKEKNDAKTMYKYAIWCERNMDSILKNNQTLATLQTTSMYNFQRMLQEVASKELQTEQTEKRLITTLFLVFILFSGLVFIYKSYKKKITQKQKDLEFLTDKYLCLEEELRRKELEQKKYDNEYQELQNEIDRYKQKFNNMHELERKMNITKQDIFKKFKQMARSYSSSKSPTKEDWDELENMFAAYYPLINEKISKNKVTRNLEFRVCILTRLQFSNYEMTNLLKSSNTSISNTKSKANERLYGEKSAITLYHNMLNK